MKKRVALLGIYHESNTFVERATDYDDFKNSHLLEGQAILAEYRDAYHEIGGMMAGLSCEEIELVPVYFAEATPGGTVAAGCYQQLLAEMMEALERAGELDGVSVAVHGAGVSDDFPDMDGHWLQMLRQRVGAAIPIVGTLDPHANVSQLMIDSTDALIAYRTNPHIDQRETGMKAGALMKRILLENRVVEQQLVALPLAISIEQQHTAAEPCASLYALAREIEAEEQIDCLSILLGFPYADVPEMGMSLVIVSTNGEGAALNAADRIIAHISAHIEAFVGRKRSVEEIVSTVGAAEKPVLLLDMGDNIGGGSLGDSTCLLDSLEAYGHSNACICLCNPAALAVAQMHPPGHRFHLSLKGSHGHNRDEPYEVSVISKHDGRFEEQNPRHGGQRHFDMGKVVVLKTALGNIIVLSSLRVPPFSSQQLSAFGIVPDDCDYIVAKGVNAPIAAFGHICKTVVQVNTPGATQADMTQFIYKNRRKPLFPFEETLG